MSWKQLEEAMLGEASQRIELLRRRYQDEAAREEKRITKLARETEQVIIQEAEKSAQHEARRLHQGAQLGAKAEILTAKQHEISETKKAVRAAVLEWDEEKTHRLLAALFELLPAGKGTVLAGEHHKVLVEKLAGKKGLIVEDGTLPEEGGFVYRGEAAEFNLTISFLIDQLFASHRTEIAKALFD